MNYLILSEVPADLVALARNKYKSKITIKEVTSGYITKNSQRYRGF